MTVLFAACSSLLRNWSRWSGIPSRHPLSQVPQTPQCRRNSRYSGIEERIRIVLPASTSILRFSARA